MNIINELEKFSASRIMIEVIKMLATAEVGRASDALELYKMISEALNKSSTPLKNRAKDNARREAYRKTDKLTDAVTSVATHKKNNPFDSLFTSVATHKRVDVSV